ncbi:Uu.00g061760.m01.CDS01 [Anthostomella pinea]|uniref:Uu.00g061760.m01.CDS01 n=1 Tax=Anthostomella pinea TaxID=933095 RepID=A0AAI8YK63_9PEZI|nr:Uu.00g061760.m01.CDS01 [Anthostomella pinea]
MLCFQCRRIAAAATRPRSTASLASRLITSSSTSTNRARGIAFPPVLHARRPFSVPLYSTTSDAAAHPAASPPAVEKPDYLNEAESAVWDKLMAEFSPTELMVQDISGGCGSMYGIEIASNKFRGANMLKQQRMVNAVLGDQLKGWHGVQLRTKVP